jgi:hypothetical protein
VPGNALNVLDKRITKDKNIFFIIIIYLIQKLLLSGLILQQLCRQ